MHPHNEEIEGIWSSIKVIIHGHEITSFVQSPAKIWRDLAIRIAASALTGVKRATRNCLLGTAVPFSRLGKDPEELQILYVRVFLGRDRQDSGGMGGEGMTCMHFRGDAGDDVLARVVDYEDTGLMIERGDIPDRRMRVGRKQKGDDLNQSCRFLGTCRLHNQDSSENCPGLHSVEKHHRLAPSQFDDLGSIPYFQPRCPTLFDVSTGLPIHISVIR